MNPASIDKHNKMALQLTTFAGDYALWVIEAHNASSEQTDTDVSDLPNLLRELAGRIEQALQEV